MNPKVAIIIGIFSILMVLFGDENPIDEARRIRAEKYKGIDDPLIRSITDYHENESPFSSRGNGLGENGRRQKSMPRYMYPKDQHKSGYQALTGQYGTSGKVQAGKVQAGKVQAGKVQGNKAAKPQPRKNTYYPPRPLPKNKQQRPSNRYNNSPLRPRSDAHMYLNSGHRLAYRGADVFIVDERGYAMPLPNGKYRLETGQEINIQGGRKIIASN